MDIPVILSAFCFLALCAFVIYMFGLIPNTAPNKIREVYEASKPIRDRLKYKLSTTSLASYEMNASDHKACDNMEEKHKDISGEFYEEVSSGLWQLSDKNIRYHPLRLIVDDLEGFQAANFMCKYNYSRV